MKKLVILLLLLAGCDNHTSLQNTQYKSVFKKCLKLVPNREYCSCFASGVYEIDDETFKRYWSKQDYEADIKVHSVIASRYIKCFN